VISIQSLSKKIKKVYPTISKPVNYAVLILEGKRCNAINRSTAIKRREFLKNENISTTTFSSGYNKFKFLIVLRNADKILVTSSNRYGLIFSIDLAISILGIERNELYIHIQNNKNVKRVLCSYLKISESSSIDKIKSNVEKGDKYQQIARYTFLYNKLKNNGNLINKCKWLGIVSMPSNLYYLSPKSQSLLKS